MIGQALQCARVDVWPNRTGNANLPTVDVGTTTAACVMCRAQVWVSKPARDLVARGDLTPVCDSCKPANTVTLTPDSFS